MDEPDTRPIDEETGPRFQARRDVVEGLDEWFTPAGDDPTSAWRCRSDIEEHGELTNGRVVAVAWRYEAEPRRSVWGVAADRGTVTIDGVTFVDAHAGDDVRFTRYIDWHGVFTQLGVAAAGHIVQ